MEEINEFIGISHDLEVIVYGPDDMEPVMQDGRVMRWVAVDAGGFDLFPLQLIPEDYDQEVLDRLFEAAEKKLAETFPDWEPERDME